MLSFKVTKSLRVNRVAAFPHLNRGPCPKESHARSRAKLVAQRKIFAESRERALPATAGHACADRACGPVRGAFAKVPWGDGCVARVEHDGMALVGCGRARPSR